MCVYKYSAVETGEGKQQRGVVVDQLIKDQECTVVGVVHVMCVVVVFYILHVTTTNKNATTITTTPQCVLYFFMYILLSRSVL